MDYIGEHSLFAFLGRASVALAFSGSVATFIFYSLYYAGSKKEKDKHLSGLKSAGRLSFLLHSIGVIGTISILFVALFNHWFEFDYVWRHSSLEMPMKYIASCFWEGQELSLIHISEPTRPY